MDRFKNIQEQFENSWPRAEGCDAKNPSIYTDREGKIICRCLICNRCQRHTGNNTQGHYWKLCNVMMNFHHLHGAKSTLDCNQCMPDYHQCCPDDCEIYNEDGTRK